jgi:hypothetical protein
VPIVRECYSSKKTTNLEATYGGGTAYLLQQRYGVGVKQSTVADMHTVKAGTCLPRMLEMTGTSSDVVVFMKRAKGSEPKRSVDALCGTSRAKPVIPLPFRQTLETTGRNVGFGLVPPHFFPPFVVPLQTFSV